MDFDWFGVVEVLESHDGLDEEGLGIIEVEMEEGPEREGKSCGTAKSRGCSLHHSQPSVYALHAFRHFCEVIILDSGCNEISRV